jgi:PKD repeat protein
MQNLTSRRKLVMSGTKILVVVGQSNGNGFAFTANQIAVPNISFPYAAVKEIDHGATINGDPLVWTFDRPVTLGNTLPSPVGVVPVSLSPRTGDANGDSGVELSLMRRLDRAWPGRWALAKMCIPSSSMLNWIAPPDTSAYPTATPHLWDQWLAFLTFCEVVFNGKIWAVNDHQGESDAQTAPLSSTWEARKINFIVGTRNFLARTTPWFLPRLHSTSPGSFNATIRTATANIANNTTGNTPRCKMIDIDSVGVTTLHYTDDQYAVAGVVESRDVISFLDLTEPPASLFSWSWSGTTVTFTDASVAGVGRTIVSRLYDFGDASTSTSTNPVHVYSVLGTYTVTLKTTDDRGSIDICTRLVTCAAGNWTVDAKSGRAVPATSGEVAALFAAAGLGFSPTSAYLPGTPTATPIADIVGAFPLTVAGATVEFQSTVPNWNTKALRTINNVTDGASTTDAALPDVLTTSCLAIVQAAIWTTPTSTRGVVAMGTTETQLSFNNANPPRMLVRSNTQSTTGTADVNNDVHLLMLRHNRTASTCKMITDLEPPVTCTFATSVTGKRFRIGLTSSASPGAQFVHVMRIDGANSELSDAQCKTLGNVMGYVMP